MHLIERANHTWEKHYWDCKARTKHTETVSLGKELMAFLDTDLSYLAAWNEELTDAGQKLLYQRSKITDEQFLQFRERLIVLLREISEHDMFLCALANSGLRQYDTFVVNDLKSIFADRDEFFDIVKIGTWLPDEILRTHFLLDQAMEDLQRELPLETNPWLPPLLSSHASIRFSFERGVCIREMHFGTVKDYYGFLLHYFLESGQPLLRCERCGKLFLQEGKRIPKYCNRTDGKGRTCRQLGPVERHKEIARQDPVIEAFDRTKRRMYKRMERTADALTYAEPVPQELNAQESCNCGLSLNGYYDWLAEAEAARAVYLSGTLPASAALQILEGA